MNVVIVLFSPIRGQAVKLRGNVPQPAGQFVPTLGGFNFFHANGGAIGPARLRRQFNHPAFNCPGVAHRSGIVIAIAGVWLVLCSLSVFYAEWALPSNFVRKNVPRSKQKARGGVEYGVKYSPLGNRAGHDKVVSDKPLLLQTSTSLGGV